MAIPDLDQDSSGTACNNTSTPSCSENGRGVLRLFYQCANGSIISDVQQLGNSTSPGVDALECKPRPTYHSSRRPWVGTNSSRHADYIIGDAAFGTLLSYTSFKTGAGATNTAPKRHHTVYYLSNRTGISTSIASSEVYTLPANDTSYTPIEWKSGPKVPYNGGNITALGLGWFNSNALYIENELPRILSSLTQNEGDMNRWGKTSIKNLTAA